MPKEETAPTIDGIRMRQVFWENCPNCDAGLPKRIAIGDWWECTECGEEGEREPGGRWDYAPLFNPFGPVGDDDGLDGDCVFVDDGLPF